MLQRILESGKTVMEDGSEVPVSGGSTVNNLRIIRGLLFDQGARDTLEIGMAYGVSALTILATQTELRKTDFTHTAIDPFQTSIWKRAGVLAIDAAGYSKHFHLIENVSSVVLPELWRGKRQFDLIYIDGSHLFEDVFIDFYYSCRIAKVGAFIMFDDCTDPNVAKVLRFVERNFARFLQRYDVHRFKEKTLKSLVARVTNRQQAKVYRKVAEPPREWNASFRGF